MFLIVETVQIVPTKPSGLWLQKSILVVCPHLLGVLHLHPGRNLLLLRHLIRHLSYPLLLTGVHSTLSSGFCCWLQSFLLVFKTKVLGHSHSQTPQFSFTATAPALTLSSPSLNILPLGFFCPAAFFISASATLFLPDLPPEHSWLSRFTSKFPAFPIAFHLSRCFIAPPPVWEIKPQPTALSWSGEVPRWKGTKFACTGTQEWTQRW